MNPFRRPYTVLTPSEGQYLNGEWVEGTYIESSALFSVQSIKDTQEVEHLAEGRRIDDFRRLYSDSKLQITNDGGSGDLLQPALIVIDGFNYELIHREPWQNGIINHYKYYCVRKYDG